MLLQTVQHEVQDANEKFLSMKRVFVGKYSPRYSGDVGSRVF